MKRRSFLQTAGLAGAAAFSRE
ncbi:MAG: hypothetical protein DMG26_00400, partial [Acidobacteria bacterium]